MQGRRPEGDADPRDNVMRVIGGLVCWELSAPATPLLAEVTARIPGAQAVAEPRTAPVAVFGTCGPGSVHVTSTMAITSDLDLTNRDELRKRVSSPAPMDAALLEALYARDGEDFVRELHGGFSFGLWDGRRRRLLLAVDRFGIKRLYHASSPRSTGFSSRANTLRSHVTGGSGASIDAIFGYLNFGFVPASLCGFEGIARLAPGTVLIAEDGRVRTRAYYDLRYEEVPLARAQAERRVFAVTAEAVAAAVGDAPPKEIGAFLSGGTDSSTVVGLLARRSAGVQVNAFSIGFREASYDELAYAEIAARHFGAAHYTHVITPEEAFDALPALVEAYEEPFGNNSAIGTFLCAKLARETGVSRLLAGDGGDEIFGGNERYRWHQVFQLYHRLPAAVRRSVLEPALLRRGPLPGVLGRVQRYIARANVPNPRRFYAWQFFFSDTGASLLEPSFVRGVGAGHPYQLVETLYKRAGDVAELNRLLYLDMKLTIGDNDLLKVTRTAELAGLDVRFPYLDPALVDLTGTLPVDFKVRGLEKRYLFKRAFRSLLPPEILAKRKHGFGVPAGQWLKAHPRWRAFARETLLSSRALERPYFRRDAAADLFSRHETEPSPYYGDILWTILMLELWHRHHVDGDGS